MNYEAETMVMGCPFAAERTQMLDYVEFYKHIPGLT